MPVNSSVFAQKPAASAVMRLLLLLLPGILAAQLPHQYTFHTTGRADTSLYYFLSTYKMRKTPSYHGMQMIIDGKGHTVYYHPKRSRSDFKVHPCGVMSFYNNYGKYALMDQQFRIYDSVGTVNGITTDNHDLQILADKRMVLMGWHTQEEDLSKHHVVRNTALFGSRRAEVRYHLIQELDSNKKLLRQWSSNTHFQPWEGDPWFRQDTLHLDVAHFNSVDVTEEGYYLISARYCNEVFKVDPISGKAHWRLGGNFNDIRVLNDSVPFLGQHDARWHRGSILTVFDNGFAGPQRQHPVRALKYRINETTRTAELLLSYTHPGKPVSESTGSLQLFDDGSMLINYGQISGGNPNVTFQVIDSSGVEICSLAFADTLGSYRTLAFKAGFLENLRPQIETVVQGDHLLLRLKDPHPAYLWNDGSSGKELIVRRPGIYYVYVPVGSGGYISSRVLALTKADFPDN